MIGEVTEHYDMANAERVTIMGLIRGTGGGLQAEPLTGFRDRTPWLWVREKTHEAETILTLWHPKEAQNLPLLCIFQTAQKPQKSD